MKFRAFVSSTYQDLKEHREYVIEALLNAGIAVDPMERWTAATDEPKYLSQERVIGCNLCVLLVGFRRGHVPENSYLSITQMEYEKAISEGCDVLVFMLAEGANWPKEIDERGSDAYLLVWRSHLQEKHVVGFFDRNPDSIKIEPALSRWLLQKQSESLLLEGLSKREILERDLVRASPYTGLRRFEAEDTDRFFGRERWIEKLCAHLASRNLILLLGASGSGKSSVIRAGVIPQLRSQGLGKRFLDLTFTPDEDPFESLYGALLGQGFKQSEVKLVRQGEPDSLVEMVRSLKQEDEYWVIFVDQFEELFTISRRDKRAAFVEGFVRLVDAELEEVKLVLAMRADFADRITPYPDLGRAIEGCHWFFTDMSPVERKEAIVKPAAQHGVVLEEGLLPLISSDFQKTGSLPLLQYTLNLLWQNDDISDRVLNIETYHRIGGVEGALQQQADKIYRELELEEQVAAETIFTALVDVQGETPVSRRAERERFTDGGVLERTLDKLIGSRLLVTGTQYSAEVGVDKTVEVAHETLLTAWPLVREWVAEKAETIVLRNRLADDAEVWDELRGKGDARAADELWSGSKLERVLELREQGELAGLSSKVDDFVGTSVDARDWLQRQEEERNRRELRRARRTSLILAGFSTILVALSLVVMGIWQRSQRQLVISKAQGVEVLLASTPTRGLVQAIEAVGTSRSWLVRFPNWSVPVIAKRSLVSAVERSQERDILSGHQGGVLSVGVSQDGSTIVSGGDDGTVRLWDFRWETWLDAACNRLRDHSILENPIRGSSAFEAKRTCERHVW